MKKALETLLREREEEIEGLKYTAEDMKVSSAPDPVVTPVVDTEATGGGARSADRVESGRLDKEGVQGVALVQSRLQGQMNLHRVVSRARRLLRAQGLAQVVI